jgi:hypothetical protein
MADRPDEDELALVRDETEALGYLASFDWCPPVDDLSYAGGVPGVVSLFQVKFFEPVSGTADDKLWIVVGDLPPAYLVVEPADTAKDVVSEYCDLMEEWVLAVRAKGDLSDVFPVRAEATEEMANMLSTRISLLRGEVIENLP